MIREAYKAALITRGETWMDMLKSRKLTSHSYNEDTAAKIAKAILNDYFYCFKALENKLLLLSQNNPEL